ncbi:MAG: HAMP domain-containing sensor histidine kinase [Bacteroidota bacterium]
MKKSLILVIIFSMTLSLIGLVGIQIFWIRNAIELREQQFDVDVMDALDNTIEKLSKIELANELKTKILKKINPGLLVDNYDTLGNRMNTGDTLKLNIVKLPTTKVMNKKRKVEKKPNVNVDINHTNKGGEFLKAKEKQNAASPGDSTSSLVIPSEDEMNKHFAYKLGVINDVLIELLSKEFILRTEDRINKEMIDTVLRTELLRKNVTLPYEFGVYNSIDTSMYLQKSGAYGKELQHSKYRVHLFPGDMFSGPDYLILYFPGKARYLMNTMLSALLIAAVLLIIIALTFTYTLFGIFRQKRLNDMKNDFINNMTHEFKTPISTISLACEAMGDPDIIKTEQKTKKYIGIIDEENRRLGILAENVLQTALMEKGQLRFRFETIDVHKIINDVIKNLALQVEKKRGRIITNFNANTPVLRGDKMHLTNMVYNLLDNANKYTPTEPILIISTRNDEEKKGLVISFEDNGIGISKSSQKRIFDKLYRVHTGNLHNVKGFGLGLSYVKAIVDKHSGSISLESELGKGSIFTVFIPFGEEETEK